MERSERDFELARVSRGSFDRHVDGRKMFVVALGIDRFNAREIETAI
jgi:hypothetical protein